MKDQNIKGMCASSTNIPWKRSGEYSYFKLLRVCTVTGSWVSLMRTMADTTVPPHKHISAAEYFVLKGTLEIEGGKENGGITALAGDYGYEPIGAVHNNTTFPETTEYLFISHGPIQFLDKDGNTSFVVDCFAMQKYWENAEVFDQVKDA